MSIPQSNRSLDLEIDRSLSPDFTNETTSFLAEAG